MLFLAQVQDALENVARDLPGGLVVLYAFLLAGCISIITALLRIFLLPRL